MYIPFRKNLDDFLVDLGENIATHEMDVALRRVARNVLQSMSQPWTHLRPRMKDKIISGIYQKVKELMPQEYLDKGYARLGR